MRRQSKTRTLIESHLGQHLALSVAAHLARTQLVPEPLKVYDSQHMADMVDVVASALTRVATFYVQDTMGGEPRELTPAELQGSTVRGAGTILMLKDGRTLSSISIKRGDLRKRLPFSRPYASQGSRRSLARRKCHHRKLRR